MKRKILVLLPILALTMTGCFARTPLPARSDQTTKTSSSTSAPEETTYGTMEAPITVARAIEIAKEQFSDLKAISFVDKDAYVKGIVKTTPKESKKEDNKGTYEFKMGDAYESKDFVDFYYGAPGDNVTVPVEGDEVVIFGRLAAVDGGETIRFVGSAEDEVANPVIKSSAHVSYPLTKELTGKATVTGLPETAMSGTTINFTVTPDSGFDIDEVLINGIYDYAADNKYSFTVTHATKVTISAVQGLVKSDVRKAFEAGLTLASGAHSESRMTFEGTVVGMAGNSFFVQDGKYGMYVYNVKVTGNAVGKKVSVNGFIQNYNGVIETWSDSKDSTTAVQAEITGVGTMPAPGSVTSLATLANLRQNVLAEAKNVKFVSKDYDWASGQNSIATFEIGDETFKVKFDKYGYNETEAKVLNGLKEGDVVNLLSVVTTVNYGTPQFLFLGTSSFTKNVEPVVGPTSITINGAPEKMHVGDKATLTPTVKPDNTTEKTVEWSTSNDQVITVGKTTGAIEAVAVNASPVTITATSTMDKSVKASVQITVDPIAVTKVDLNKKNLTLKTGGEPFDLIATVEPDNATDQTVVWSLQSGGDYVTLDTTNGRVTPKSAVGNAVVRATSHSNPDVYAECEIEVISENIPVTGVTFDITSKEVKVNGYFTITATVIPDNATNPAITWESADPTYVEVTQAGKVTGLKVTTDPIKVTAKSVENPSIKAECSVTVLPSDPETVTVEPKTKTLTVDQEFTLTATVAPSTALQTVTWSSSDPESVSVNETTGVIKGLKVTTDAVTITATSTADANVKGTCAVTVEDVFENKFIEAYEAALKVSGTTVTDEFEFQGVVVAKRADNEWFLQYEGYGIEYYGTNSDLAVGKEVRVKATLQNYKGLPETKTISSTTIIGDGIAPTPIEIASGADVTAAKLGVLANVTGKAKVDWSSYSATSDTTLVLIGSDEAEINVYLKRNLFSDKAATIQGVKAGDTVTFTNVVTSIYNNPQILFAVGSDLTVTPKPVVEPTAIEFKSGTYEISIGGAGLDMSGNVVLTPADATTTITYSIKDEPTGISVTAAGVVSASSEASAGTIVLIATTSNSLSAQVNITVKSEHIPTEQLVYTLDGTINGTGNTYAGDNTASQGGIDWVINGNLTQNPWRIGGNSLSGVDRVVRSTKTMADDISKIVITHGTANSVTVNSITLIVSSKADFSDATSTLTGTFKASGTTTFTRPNGVSWANMYFKVVYNLTISSTSNKYVQFTKAEFYSVK